MRKKSSFILMGLFLFTYSLNSFAVLESRENEEAVLKEIINLRRDLHRIPELGNKEFKTKQFILDYLGKINKKRKLTIIPILKTGVLAVLKGDREGSILFRADIDALPIQEKTGVPFQSEHRGRMHACGHDAHTAILLKLVDCLLRETSKKHTLVFLFQPAEEVKGGADEIVSLKILDPYNIKAAFALHIHPGLETGKIGYIRGASMAASFYFDLKIDGPGGHMADSDANYKNPILLVPEFLDYFYNKLPKIGSKPELVKIGVTKANGGVKSNIIPPTFSMGGSLRTLDIEVQNKLEQVLNKELPGILQGTPFTLGKLKVRSGAPILVNDENLVEQCLRDVKKNLSHLSFVELEPSYFSEDFAFYSQLYPSFYFSLGCQYYKDRPTYVHTSTLRIDEKALIIGLKMFMVLSKKEF